MRIFKLAVAGCILTGLGLTVLFAYQNAALLMQRIVFTLDLFVVSMSSQPLPLFLVLLLAFASGLVLACAYFAFSYVRQSYLLRKRDKQIQGLEKELEHLQSDPSVDAPSLRNFNTRKL